MQRRRTGNAFDAARPDHDFADFLCRDVAKYARRFAEIAADPFRSVDVAGDDPGLFADDADDAAGRQPLGPQRVLEEFELSPDRDDGADSARAIFHPAGDGNDPVSGHTRAEDLTDRGALALDDLPEEFTIFDVAPHVVRRRSDTAAVERIEQHGVDHGRQVGA